MSIQFDVDMYKNERVTRLYSDVSNLSYINYENYFGNFKPIADYITLLQ